jgi:hypothetical protein
MGVKDNIIVRMSMYFALTQSHPIFPPRLLFLVLHQFLEWDAVYNTETGVNTRTRHGPTAA